jgi:hypothetical protein
MLEYRQDKPHAGGQGRLDCPLVASAALVSDCEPLACMPLKNAGQIDDHQFGNGASASAAGLGRLHGHHMSKQVGGIGGRALNFIYLGKEPAKPVARCGDIRRAILCRLQPVELP